MNKYGEIILCRKSALQDCIGQAIDTSVEERKIQCVVDSVGRSEWITAAQGGYQAEIMVKVFSASYNGESLASYNGKTYEVYRTYQSGDMTELYLGTRIGDIP